MTQANGLSPRNPKQYNTSDSPSTSANNRTPQPITSPKRFFQDDQQSSRSSESTLGVSARADKPMFKGHDKASSLPEAAAGSFARLRASVNSAFAPRPTRRSPSLRFMALAAIAVTAVPWMCSRGGSSPSLAIDSASRRAQSASTSSDRCADVKWGRVASRDRSQCSPLLPATVVDGRGWLVAVHVDRAPKTAALSRKKLRGNTSFHRDLPHQYFVRAMEATLHSISKADPGANVDVTMFTEGRWGGLVDETGVPVDWDVPREICEDLGLHCTQTLVQINDRASAADSIECIAAADILVASENEFSVAASFAFNQVKVLTDKSDMDEDEIMVTLDPASTVRGMASSTRQFLNDVVSDYHECS